jgi:hypothetical protein
MLIQRSPKTSVRNNNQLISHKVGKALLSILILFTFLISSCAQGRAENFAENIPAAEAPMPEERLLAESAASDAAVANQDVERIVIKNANMSMVVDDPKAVRDAIGKMAEDMGGFIVASRVYQDTLENGQTVTRAEITVRVPAERLDEAMDQIRNQSDQPPLTENLDSQDVTREYVDLQSRLRNEEAAEAQLTELMEQAKTTEDVLSVYTELVQVRQRIEELEGQIQYYEQSAALSAISVDLQPNEAVQPITIGGWQPTGTAKNALQAMINTMQGIAEVVIWMAIWLLPVLLVLFIIFGLPIILIIWLIRRRRRRKATPVQPTPPPVTPET